jgi:hypothetical protein
MLQQQIQTLLVNFAADLQAGQLCASEQNVLQCCWLTGSVPSSSEVLQLCHGPCTLHDLGAGQ